MVRVQLSFVSERGPKRRIVGSAMRRKQDVTPEMVNLVNLGKIARDEHMRFDERRREKKREGETQNGKEGGIKPTAA